MIFKAVRDGRPYPEHGLSARDWSTVAPRTLRLSELVTTKRTLALDHLLD
jgi:Arc/MetJ family transcription regulator